MRAETDTERAERLRYEYEERAAILEFDAGYTRAVAETLARRMVYGAGRADK